MKISRRYSIMALAAVTAVTAWAYNVSGVVTDYATGDPMIDATVRLLQMKDSTFVKGAMTDDNGAFRMTDIKKGSYLLETTYIGYSKDYVNIDVKSNTKLDTIRIAESAYMLKETTVIGVKTPIKVMQDTIEYNADSYKTQPNAVVEDLLKRLPGVEIDSDGKITANGKQVGKILFDGKEFFGDDPKVASKNIPANMIEKLQVVDRKSELARLTGVDDGEEETVINLTIKEGMKKGWQGTFQGGYGTDDRYLGSLYLTHLWGNNQLTFIGNANNTNDLGFTDGNGDRFRRFGGNRGINSTESFGVNFSLGKDERLRFGGNVNYNHSNRHTVTSRDRQYLFADDSKLENSHTNSRDKGHNIRSDFRIEWKPDSFNTLDFRPAFSYNTNNSASSSYDNMWGARLDNGQTVFDTPINNSLNWGSSHGNSVDASGRLIYNHNFASHRGRSFSIMGNYSFSNTREYENSLAYTYFSQRTTGGSAMTEQEFEDMTQALDDYMEYVYEQQTDNRTWSNNVSGRVSWTEPLGNVANGNFLTVSYRIQYRWNNRDKIVDQRSPIENPWLLPDPLNPDFASFVYGDWEFQPDISNQFRNNYMTQDIRVGFKKVNAKYTLETGLSVVPSMSKSINLINSAKNIPERWVWNYAPFLRFRYRMDKQSSINIDYNGRSSEPSMNQLQPVVDNSNPLNIVQGNPNLSPSFNHNLRTRLQKFWPESQRSVMVMLDASMTQNAIISKTTFDNQTGGRYTTYENVNGVWSAQLMNMFSQPFGHNKQWSFNNHIFINTNQQIGYNNGLRNRSTGIMLAESPAIAFRPENLELELRPNYRMSSTMNTLSGIATTTTHNYGGTFNGTWYAPLNIILATDLTYTATKGYMQGYDQKEWMWNASVSYQFLRNKAGVLMLKVYDLLQQKSNISRSVTANYIDDTRYNSLTRFFMITFTYKFQTFGKGHRDDSYEMQGPRGPEGERGERGGRRGGFGGPPPGGMRP
ncbi:MAG: outer membrane beta-barrel protein [Bacteroidales bacterium]|nr:outer membrane beta-barrel protein [Bacteroidales bacterium]